MQIIALAVMGKSGKKFLKMKLFPLFIRIIVNDNKNSISVLQKFSYMTSTRTGSRNLLCRLLYL